jgi:hypothetical protein
MITDGLTGGWAAAAAGASGLPFSINRKPESVLPGAPSSVGGRKWLASTAGAGNLGAAPAWVPPGRNDERGGEGERPPDGGSAGGANIVSSMAGAPADGAPVAGAAPPGIMLSNIDPMSSAPPGGGGCAGSAPRPLGSPMPPSRSSGASGDAATLGRSPRNRSRPCAISEAGRSDGVDVARCAPSASAGAAGASVSGKRSSSSSGSSSREARRSSGNAELRGATRSAGSEGANPLAVGGRVTGLGRGTCARESGTSPIARVRCAGAGGVAAARLPGAGSKKSSRTR